MHIYIYIYIYIIYINTSVHTRLQFLSKKLCMIHKTSTHINELTSLKLANFLYQLIKCQSCHNIETKLMATLAFNELINKIKWSVYTTLLYWMAKTFECIKSFDKSNKQ